MAAKAKYSGPLEKGREICCYRIEEPLGSGGMGEGVVDPPYAGRGAGLTLGPPACQAQEGDRR